MAAAGGGATEPMSTCTPPASTDTDPCTAPLKPGDDRLCKMMIGGQEREFYIYASPKFDPCTPASMIMDCHGASESIDVHTGREGFNLSGQMFPGGYGSFWHRAVQEDNAIIVTPAGIGMRWAPMTDTPFVNAAADQIEKIAKINPERVYITGISMGGMQTVATGCDNAKRWRGMAPVAMLTQSCAKLDRPTPTISFHAMGDQLTSYDDDLTNMTAIAKFNNCKMGPTDSVQYGGMMSSPDPVCITMPNGVGDMDAPDRFSYPLMACDGLPVTKCRSWTECDEGVEVVFCTVDASTQPIGGHILYANDSQLALGVVGWNFFKKFWK
jgi:poly(3-hydroxybutyrate) depolymerase